VPTDFKKEFTMARQSYHPLIKLLHWITVILLVGTSLLGFYFSDMPRGDEKNELLRLHASIGLLIGVVVLSRVMLRFTVAAPPPINPATKWQNCTAASVHILLYAALLLLIGAGMFALFTVGWDVPFFSLFSVPTVYDQRDMDLHHFFEEIHVAVWWCTTALVALHVCAALYHTLKLRDKTLSRMWFD